MALEVLMHSSHGCVGPQPASPPPSDALLSCYDHPTTSEQHAPPPMAGQDTQPSDYPVRPAKRSSTSSINEHSSLSSAIPHSGVSDPQQPEAKRARVQSTTSPEQQLPQAPLPLQPPSSGGVPEPSPSSTPATPKPINKAYTSQIRKWDWWITNDPATRAPRHEPLPVEVEPNQAAEFLKWVLAGTPGWKQEKLPSKSVVEQCHFALQYLRSTQMHADSRNPGHDVKLLNYAMYRQVYMEGVKEIEDATRLRSIPTGNPTPAQDPSHPHPHSRHPAPPPSPADPADCRRQYGGAGQEGGARQALRPSSAINLMHAGRLDAGEGYYYSVLQPADEGRHSAAECYYAQVAAPAGGQQQQPARHASCKGCGDGSETVVPGSSPPFTEGQYLQLQDHLLVATASETECRDQAILAMLWGGVGGGVSTCLEPPAALLCHVLSPSPLRSVGPVPCTTLHIVNPTGPVPEYWSSVRHRDPRLCPHGALGRFLLMRFVLNREPVPSPEDLDGWSAVPLWQGGQSQESVAWQSLLARLQGKFSSPAFMPAGIVSKAWSSHRPKDASPHATFPSTAPPATLLTTGGWPAWPRPPAAAPAATPPYNRFAADRFHIAVPDDIANRLFGFLPALRDAIETHLDHKGHWQHAGQPAECAAQAVPAVLQYLVTVVLQDALQMAADGRCGSHPVHVFLSQKPWFRQMLASFRQQSAQQPASRPLSVPFHHMAEPQDYPQERGQDPHQTLTSSATAPSYPAHQHWAQAHGGLPLNEGCRSPDPADSAEAAVTVHTSSTPPRAARAVTALATLPSVNHAAAYPSCHPLVSSHDSSAASHYCYTVHCNAHPPTAYPLSTWADGAADAHPPATYPLPTWSDGVPNQHPPHPHHHRSLLPAAHALHAPTADPYGAPMPLHASSTRNPHSHTALLVAEPDDTTTAWGPPSDSPPYLQPPMRSASPVWTHLPSRGHDEYQPAASTSHPARYSRAPSLVASHCIIRPQATYAAHLPHPPSPQYDPSATHAAAQHPASAYLAAPNSLPGSAHPASAYPQHAPQPPARTGTPSYIPYPPRPPSDNPAYPPYGLSQPQQCPDPYPSSSYAPHAAHSYATHDPHAPTTCHHAPPARAPSLPCTSDYTHPSSGPAHSDYGQRTSSTPSDAMQADAGYSAPPAEPTRPPPLKSSQGHAAPGHAGASFTHYPSYGAHSMELPPAPSDYPSPYPSHHAAAAHPQLHPAAPQDYPPTSHHAASPAHYPDAPRSHAAAAFAPAPSYNPPLAAQPPCTGTPAHHPASPAHPPANVAGTPSPDVVRPRDNTPKALPMLSTFASLIDVWNKLTKGDPATGEPSLLSREAGGSSAWRRGERKRWSEYKLFHDAVVAHAGQLAASAGRAITSDEAVEDLERRRLATVPRPLTVANAVKGVRLLMLPGSAAPQPMGVLPRLQQPVA